jgi:hypothetical protein
MTSIFMRYRRPIIITIALIALCLPAFHPFMVRGMPLTADGTLHLLRSIALDHSVRVDGGLWVRYSSGLAYGYGAPLFNYFPPTAYYPIVILHALGLPFVLAYKAMMIGVLWLGAAGMYCLARRWTTVGGAFVAAASFVYAPYLLFSAVGRGTLTEVTGWVMLVWAMWALTRLAQRGTRTTFLIATLIYALFIIVHNIVTLQGTLLIVLYCAFLWLSSDHKRRVFAHLLSAGLLAVLLTTFFWLPALAETDYSKINSIVASLDFIDVTRTLRSLSDVLALPHTADTTQLQASVPITLSWVPIILAGIGLVAMIDRRRRAVQSTPSALLGLLGAVVVAVIGLQLNLSAVVWRNVPLLGYSQFAWRIMGVGAVALALLAGISSALLLAEIRAQSAKITLFSVFTGFIVIYSVPWLYVPQIAVEAEDIRDVHAFERDTGALTVSSYSEYLPAWANPEALNATALQSSFAAADVVPRLQASDGVTIHTATWGGTSATLTVTLAQAQTLVFDWLYVPFWRVTVDGQALDVRPTATSGLVSFDVPTGTHDITLAIVPTRLQTIAMLVSAGAAITLIIVGVGGGRWFVSAVIDAHNADADTSQTVMLAVAVIGIGVSLFLLKALVIDRTNNPLHRRSLSAGELQGVEIARKANFNDAITFLGGDIPDRVESGAEAQISLFWTLRDATLDTDYSSRVQLRDAEGIVISTGQSFYPGDRATSDWLTGYYLHDVIDLRIPSLTPPAEYTLSVSLFDSETGQALDVIDAQGNPIGVTVTIDTLSVTASDNAPASAPNHAPILTTDSLVLESLQAWQQTASQPLSPQAQVGDELQVTWVWRARQDVDNDQQARLVWRDATGRIQGATPPLPLTRSYPTSQWQSGERWRGWQSVYVPGDLQAGTYQLGVALGDQVGIVTTMQVTTPQRTFDAPTIDTPVTQAWQNGIHLLGYARDDASLILHWRTDAQLNRSLRLFVHLLDDDGNIVAVRDGVPVGWSRPTTGWAIGEYIRTAHDFDGLTVADYRWRIGWYDPRTGQRVLLDDDADSLSIDP